MKIGSLSTYKYFKDGHIFRTVQKVCQKEIPSSNPSPMGVGGGAKWYFFFRKLGPNRHIMRRKKI
jgi:hypothetical protein